MKNISSLRQLIVLAMSWLLVFNQSCLAAPATGSPAAEESAKPAEVDLELKEGQERVEKPPANKVVAAQPLSAERITEILKRLPAKKEIKASGDFNYPPAINPPPRPGGIVQQQFPPEYKVDIPQATPGSDLLAVVRHSPEGLCSSAVPQLSVTFSQPMVPVAEAESEALASSVPVKLAPQPAGKWHWLGTQTVVFQPAGGRLPRSTEYRVLVPEGSSSALGSKLKSNFSWTISTPAAQAQSFYPQDGSSGIGLSPVLLAVFNQKINPAEAIKHIKVRAGNHVFTLRLAGAQETKADKTIADVIKEAPEGQFIAFKSTSAFLKNQHITVEIGPGLPSLEGPALGAQQRFLFTTYSPLAIKEYAHGPFEPGSSIYVQFSNELDEKLFRDSMISVYPPVADLKATRSGANIFIQGSYEANRTYSIKFASSLPDIFGQTLGREQTIQASIKRSPAELIGPRNSFAVIPANARPEFCFLSRNIPEAKITVYEASAAEFKKFQDAFQTYHQWHRSPDEYPDTLPGLKQIASRMISIHGHAEEYVQSKIDLAPYLHNGLGNVILTVEQSPRERERINRFAVWLQSTRIGIETLQSQSAQVAMVNRLDDGSPVQAAKIKWPDGRIIATTDSTGLAKLECNQSTRNELLICQKDDDQAFLLTPYYGFANPQATVRWYSVTDRNLYKPGETVQVKGWLRKITAGSRGEICLTAGGAEQIEFAVHDSRQIELKKGICQIDRHGGYNFSFELPKSCNLGESRIVLRALYQGKQVDLAEAESRQTSFRIEEFRKPEFELAMHSSAGSSLLLGESTNVTASASYFSGGPLQNSAIKWNISTSSSSFSPPGWSSFSFGQGSASHFRYRPILEQVGDENAETFNFEGTTNSTGKHVLSMRLKSAPVAVPVSIIAQATVRDVNRQEWSAKQNILVHPADVYAGIKTSKQFYRDDEELDIQAVAVDLEGKPSSGKPIHLELTRETVEGHDDFSRTVKHKICEADLLSQSSPGSWRPRANEGGNLVITAIISDSKGRKSRSQIRVWKEEKHYPQRRQAEHAKVELTADHDKYEIGQTAEIMVQAPFANSHGLVALSHNGILSTFPLVMQDSSSTIKVPITEDLMPDCTVKVTLVGSNCAYASGDISLQIPPEHRTLQLKVQPEKNKLAPGGKTEIVFDVRDYQGRPVENAQVAVAVVDESVLALTNYDWQDPCSVFYIVTNPYVCENHGRQYAIAPETLAAQKLTSQFGFRRHPTTSRAYDIRSTGITGSFAVAADGIIPSQAGAGLPRYAGYRLNPQQDNQPIAIRSDFNALAYFNPDIITNSRGIARCAVQLPDNLTRYRIMSVSVAGDHLFGKGESSITTHLPLSVQPSFPRFLNFGDRCQLPVVLKNQTEKRNESGAGAQSFQPEPWRKGLPPDE